MDLFVLQGEDGLVIDGVHGIVDELPILEQLNPHDRFAGRRRTFAHGRKMYDNLVSLVVEHQLCRDFILPQLDEAPAMRSFGRMIVIVIVRIGRGMCRILLMLVAVFGRVTAAPKYGN